MSLSQLQPRCALVESDVDRDVAAFADAVRAGLTAETRSVPCRFLYDETGSKLFEQICALPEYYVTRAEREILETHADGIAALFEGAVTLAELGSGSSDKTRLLIEALLRRHERLRYLPIDISRSILEQSALTLVERYADLEILAIAGEYQAGLRHLGRSVDRAKLIAWLGSNVGNLDRGEAARFLRGVREAMSARDRLLIGIDLRKPRDVLERAYDDAQGVTAAFTLNLLARINRELGGDFELEAFRHRASYDESAGRVDIHLVSRRTQRVTIEALDLELDFRQGEAIHAESSVKYAPGEIESLARGGGMAVERQWLDSDRRFSLSLFAPS
jgi:L-histidine N-alpha-methyltransferase